VWAVAIVQSLFSYAARMDALLPTDYSVNAFFLTHGGRSKPISVTISLEDQKLMHVTYDCSLFPSDATISQISVNVDSFLYHVYFDYARHQYNPATASYLFIHLLQHKCATNICIEDDLPDLLVILKECVFLSMPLCDCN